MGRFLERKCKGARAAVGEITVVGVRTRARTALAMAASSRGSSCLPQNNFRKASSATTKPYDVNEIRKRRRLATSAAENPVNFCTETTTTTASVSEAVETASYCSTGELCSDFPAAAACYCSSNKDRLESTPVPEKQQITTPETSPKCFDYSRLARIEKNADQSDDQDSPPRHRPDSKLTNRIKMPSASEIEEFFSVAEKDIRKRFTDKYNFDIVKDVPLEGRYEWVPTKP